MSRGTDLWLSYSLMVWLATRETLIMPPDVSKQGDQPVLGEGGQRGDLFMQHLENQEIEKKMSFPKTYPVSESFAGHTSKD